MMAFNTSNIKEEQLSIYIHSHILRQVKPFFFSGVIRKKVETFVLKTLRLHK